MNEDLRAPEHAVGSLRLPAGVGVIAGSPNGSRRTVGIVVARFNGEITSRLLDGAIAALEDAGVERDGVEVVPVPGAFELPLGAMALARTRLYSCVIALGCVIRGETPHFDFVAAEAASGLQVAALETGVPVAFGVLTCDTREQAEARAGGVRGNKGAEAARTALEMADLFGRLRVAGRPVAGRRRSARLPLYSSADVQGLRSLWEGPFVRSQPKPFDGGDEAALQPQPPACAHPRERCAAPELRLRAVPEVGPRREGALALARAALAALEASRTRIDDLNVYPVPDGDTGTNMTLTVRAVVEALERDPGASIAGRS